MQSLASCIKGEKITPTYLGDIARRLSSLRKNPPSMYIGDKSNNESIYKPVIPPLNQQKPFVQRIDFNLLKSQFSKADPEIMSNILESLRTLLTNSDSETRRKNLSIMILHDFIGLKNDYVNILIIIAYYKFTAVE